MSRFCYFELVCPSYGLCNITVSVFMKCILNQARASRRPARAPGLLKLNLCGSSVCVCVFACVRVCVCVCVCMCVRPQGY